MQTATTAPAAEPKRTRRAIPALPPTLHPEQRLPWQMVSALIGEGRSKIYDRLKAGDFPAPERCGARCVRWRAGDVLAWLSSRAKRAEAAEGAAP